MSAAPEAASTPEWRLEAGWCTAARRVPSPNFDMRPSEQPIELLVVHAISLPPGCFGGAAIEQLFTNTLPTDEHPYYAGLVGLRVSAHFLIRRNGELVQFVATQARAWHAGVSCWQGRERCNDFSIGVELEGCDEQPFEAIQYQQLARLTALLAAHHPLRAVTGHEHIAPGRKTDPGPCFDWLQFGHALTQQGTISTSLLAPLSGISGEAG